MVLNSSGKVNRSMTFDKIVLEKLKERALIDNSTVSNLANYLLRNILIKESRYYNELKKQAWLDFQKYKFLEEEAALIELKGG